MNIAVRSKSTMTRLLSFTLAMGTLALSSAGFAADSPWYAPLPRLITQRLSLDYRFDTRYVDDRIPLVASPECGGKPACTVRPERILIDASFELLPPEQGETRYVLKGMRAVFAHRGKWHELPVRRDDLLAGSVRFMGFDSIRGEQRSPRGEWMSVLAFFREFPGNDRREGSRVEYRFDGEVTPRRPSRTGAVQELLEAADESLFKTIDTTQAERGRLAFLDLRRLQVLAKDMARALWIPYPEQIGGTSKHFHRAIENEHAAVLELTTEVGRTVPFCDLKKYAVLKNRLEAWKIGSKDYSRTVNAGIFSPQPLLITESDEMRASMKRLNLQADIQEKLAPHCEQKAMILF